MAMKLQTFLSSPVRFLRIKKVMIFTQVVQPPAKRYLTFSSLNSFLIIVIILFNLLFLFHTNASQAGIGFLISIYQLVQLTTNILNYTAFHSISTYLNFDNKYITGEFQ